MEQTIAIILASWVALSALAAALPADWKTTQVLRAIVSDVRAIAEAIGRQKGGA